MSPLPLACHGHPRGLPRPLLWCPLLLLLLLLATVHARADEFDVLRQKWVAMITGGDAYDPNEPSAAATITSITSTANSYWNSLNKAATRSYLWSDAASTTVSADLNTNISRLRAMAVAYATRGSSLQGNATLRADIAAALQWFYTNRYNENVRIYDNWWHFEIGVPMALTDTVALLYDQLDPKLTASLMSAVDKFTPSATTPAPGGSTGTFTGANRMWKIQVVTVRGLIVKDAAKLAAARDAFSALFLYVTSGDGFYTDGSFIQHGKHPYTGGYGASLIATIAPVLALLNGPNSLRSDGSTWKVTDPNLGNVYRWVYEAYTPLLYRGGMMAMTEGREVSRNSTSEHGTGQSIMQSILRLSELAPAPDQQQLRSLVRGWALADTSRDFVGIAPLGLKPQAAQLLADTTVLLPPERLGNVVFGNMDRIVHAGHGFTLGLSLSSSRIYTYESINGENLHGWYSGDGMTYLYNGDLVHYSDGFWPTVDPRRLPGTTVDAEQPRADGSGQSTAPASPWAGGASLDTIGVAGMQLRGWGNSLRANKSWFMLGDEIVCLGGAITSTDNRRIQTTVENRLLSTAGNDAFTVDGRAQLPALGATASLTNPKWAHLAGRVGGADIGYYFPTPAVLNAVRETRTASWSQINTGGPTTPFSRNYVTLWFDHGANPSAATYAYVLLPGRTAAQTAEYAAHAPLQIIENSAAAHTVKHTTLGVTAANFWNDAAYASGGISVDHAASVVVRETNGFVAFAVSDPTQLNSGTLTVEFAAAGGAVYSADAGVTVTQIAPTIKLAVAVGGAHGRTFHAVVTAPANPAPRMTNLSTRAAISGSADTVIAGFVITGTGTKRLVIRAAGPALAAFGATGVLPNPRITLNNASGTVLAENDDWDRGTDASAVSAAFASVGAFGFAPQSRDAALVVSLPPGAYTAVVRSADPGGTGLTLVEVYDADAAGDARLINVSSRVYSGTGAASAIVGFSLTGGSAAKVLVRAAGPALAGFQVSGVLPNPQLHLAALGGAAVADNDDWSSAFFAPAIVGATTAVGAFPFGDGGKDAETLVTLPAGSYTAVVTDAAGAAGQAIVEAYAVPAP